MTQEQWEKLNANFCRHLEHAANGELLSDYTAALYFMYPPEDREEAKSLLKAQLYDRRLSAKRVDSWLVDCRERMKEETPQGFWQRARAEYVQRQMAAQEAQQAGAEAQKPARRLRLRPAVDFAPEQAEYLVEPYLPRGMLTILGGVSGSGKTSLALAMAAAVTRGQKLPFDQREPGGARCFAESVQSSGVTRTFENASKCVAKRTAETSSTGGAGCFAENAQNGGAACDSKNASKCVAKSTAETPSADGATCAAGVVFYLTAENDPNKVLRPRVERLGADLTKLYFQDGASMHMQDAALEELCRAYRPALLVFDPIQSYLGPGVQMNRAEQVRPILDKLSALAKELDMTVLLISHMSKPGPGVATALDRLLGSSDFRNAARSILIVGRDPDDADRRVFAHAKNSLGLPGPSQAYRITEGGVVAYEGACDLAADRIIRESENAGPGRTGRPAASLNDAVRALDQLVGFVGWVNVSEAYQLCAQRGFSDRTMRKAKMALGLCTLKVGKPPNQKAFWYRNDLTEDEVLADVLGQNEQLFMSGPKRSSGATVEST